MNLNEINIASLDVESTGLDASADKIKKHVRAILSEAYGEGESLFD